LLQDRFPGTGGAGHAQQALRIVAILDPVHKLPSQPNSCVLVAFGGSYRAEELCSALGEIFWTSNFHPNVVLTIYDLQNLSEEAQSHYAPSTASELE
jgi:hypothetical protein